MEYTDYYVAKGSADDVRGKVEKACKQGVVVDGLGDFVPFVAVGKTDRLPKTFGWLLRVFDAEGSAWGFELWVDGKQLGSATYGENAEWGIDGDDNGFDGDEAKVAEALGATAAKLRKCLNDDGVERFCKLVGFEHQYTLYAHEDEMPDGVTLLSEIG